MTDVRGRQYQQLSRGSVIAHSAALDVTEWDDEELKRGYRRGKDGHFRGHPPRVVPRACYAEFQRRQFAQAQLLMLADVPAAIQTLMAIIKNPRTEDKDKIKAIDLVLNRTMGKSVERIDVSVHTEDPPWMRALEAGIVDVDHEGRVIETTATAIDATSIAYGDEDELDDDDIIIEDD